MCGIWALLQSTPIPVEKIKSGVLSINHRGRDSTRILMNTSNQNNTSIQTWTNYGKLNSASFNDNNHRDNRLSATAQMCISQTRYITSRQYSYSSVDYNHWNDPSDPIHPPENLLKQIPPLQYNDFQIAHNGTVDHDLLVSLIKKEPVLGSLEDLTHFTDTQLIGLLIQTWLAKTGSIQKSLIQFREACHGAYSLILTDYKNNVVWALRDPLGIRPLSFSYLANNRIEVSSESSTFTTKDDSSVYEIKPGELVQLSLEGCRHYPSTPPYPCPLASCVFEYVYLSHPESLFNGICIRDARMEMGYRLAMEEKTLFDPKTTAVACVPRTALPSAQGYAQKLGLPYVDLLQPVKSVARTFLLSNPQERYKLALQKFTVHLTSEYDHIKDWIFVDDSLVRGNTWYAVQELVREAIVTRQIKNKNLDQDQTDGSSTTLPKYHLRLACPPIHYPDVLGIDIPTREELLANYRVKSSSPSTPSSISSFPSSPSSASSSTSASSTSTTVFPFPHPPVELQPPGTPVDLESLAEICQVDTIDFLSFEGSQQALSSLNPRLPASVWSMSWHNGQYPLNNHSHPIIEQE